jgi:hypothetical protein
MDTPHRSTARSPPGHGNPTDQHVIDHVPPIALTLP